MSRTVRFTKRPHVLPALLIVGALALAACADRGPGAPVGAAAIADSLRSLVRTTYDLSAADVPGRMRSLYPREGRVVSASAGRVSTTRDSLVQAIDAFWTGVGQHMQRPKWTWGVLDVEVVGPDAALMTATYTVPHWTPDGAPHVIGGAWTALWQRREGRWVITHEHLSDLPRPYAEALEQAMPRSDAPATTDTVGHHHER